MSLEKLLIANRGEIAIRIARAATELDIATVSVYSSDDAGSLHVGAAGESCALEGIGAAAYLDIAQIVGVAKESGCDAVHPGYGFLAENADFARRCAEEGLTFVGPSVESLELFGDKARARALAQEHDVPVLPGTPGAVTVEEASAFLEGLGAGGAIVIKALAGGGGRGMRVVEATADLAEAYARCQSEAKAAFGSDAVYAEELIGRARHIEIQVVGDGSGVVSQLGERECSVQRRHQKIVEIAPSPTLSAGLREKIAEAAVRMAAAVDYLSLGTFEFLVDATVDDRFVFIEANPRLQVEHTVTEEVTGVDLVQSQLRIAGGDSLGEVGLTQEMVPAPRGFAIQSRVNLEQMQPDGTVRPSGGVLTSFVAPSGPGVRVDAYGYAGYATNPNFDSLLGKVIAWTPSADFGAAVKRSLRALDEFQIGGVETNLGFLRNVLGHADFEGGRVYTRWVDDHVSTLAVVEEEVASETVGGGSAGGGGAGAKLDSRDPLSSLNFFREGAGTRQAGARGPAEIVGPPNTEPVGAPLQGTVIEIQVAVGDEIREGQLLAVMSALKMEHLVNASLGGVVRQITVEVGDTVYEEHPMFFVERSEVGAAIVEEKKAIDLDYIRPELQALFDRRAFGEDANRPAAVERRHSKNRRTVRENIEMLIDPGTWIEYGQLGIAGQRRKRSLEELIWKTPADGLVAGIGSVNGEHFDDDRNRVAFISYDDTVFAGTQGMVGHHKTDRMVDLAYELSLPVIFHAEGAGGRSGETDGFEGRGFGGDVRTWDKMCRLSGTVPMIGITAGWCYAGNAAILGVTDLIIATEDALIAMGGPSTIEGGGMGAFLPEEVGPISDIAPAGTVDLVVKDQDEAIAMSKKLLSYFQGAIKDWECEDQRLLRHVIPENRMRPFDVREVIRLMADKDSVVELRREFGVGMVTAFVRIEGRPFGLTANNNSYIGGAIDSDGSDKVARFWQLCDAWNIPIITVVDTPGMMVGPDVERTGLVRHCSRLFVTGANLVTPRFAVILRKGYALGSMAMLTGSARASHFTVDWPTGEHGGMNVESGVLLSNREMLATIEDVDERAAKYQSLVDAAYVRGGSLNVSSTFEIDNTIDPAETRYWVMQGLKACPNPDPIRRGRAQFMDTW
ncbi:MAG: Pyruvate carboxylase/Acetyl-CoA carboxylase [Chloroflexi bacterium]|nr:MAG: Pyruvate carboxylase/Acetyl-CoA carboxylase [Chloroflexota bacterium]